MPSREKLAIRRAFGDLRDGEFSRFPFDVPFPLRFAPFVTSWSRGDAISIENLSLDMEKVLPLPADAEVGDPSGELDIVPVMRLGNTRSSNLHHKMNSKLQVDCRMYRR